MKTATYSPEDNKLRLYTVERLDPETYARVKAVGFKWAPKQDLFVAPMWTPGRENLLIELCGEIEDEDTSLVERAEERAERFEDYSDKRAEDADRAKKAVDKIADGIPFGQPILIGHHSERHARRDAKKIENGMRRAVQMWETSKYWEDRAKGAIRHAKYKERPDVRARRIKGLEADKRKQEREKAQAEKFLNTYNDPNALTVTLRDGRELIPALLNTYEGGLSFEDQRKFDREEISFDEALEKAKRNLSKCVAYCDRWIKHLENRLTYEKTMLEAAGASDLIKPKPRPKQLPLCNYRAPEGICVENIYHKGEFSTYPQIEMTKTEYMAIYEGRRGIVTVGHSHRVRTYYLGAGGNYQRQCVFLTDYKVTEKPEPIEPKPKSTLESKDTRPVYAPPEPTEFDAMKETLKAGIKIVSAPQLFPTPEPIAKKMVELAEIEPGMCVLEPSAGTGNLIKAVLDTVDTEVLAYEINQGLCNLLEKTFPGYKCQVRQRDFLEVTDFQGEYPRIIMNPPFENGVDIKHIKHALTMLKPGGRLVALCANGPRQQEAFKDTADHWEVLPQGSFKQQGTGVNVALMVINL